MEYSLGLDIGIASIGWAVLNFDQERIENLGVRCFNAAEDPKTKASLALPRRLARGTRRRLRRRAGRLQRAKQLFVEYGLITEDIKNSLFVVSATTKDPWELRNLALQQMLDPHDLARALFHIIKRRGFKSNRKSVKSSSDEDGKVLENISINTQIMQERGYRTAGQMYALDEKFIERKRNTTDNYTHSVDRATLEQEIRVIFEEQKKLGSSYASDEFLDKLLAVFTWQMPYTKGDDIIKLIGSCTFEPDQIRAPKNSYSFERFMLLQKINQLSISVLGGEMNLTPEEKHTIEALAYKQAKLTYAQIRKALGLDPDQARFTSVNYFRRKQANDDNDTNPLDAEKDTFVELKGYHAMRRCFEDCGLWNSVKAQPNILDTIAEALTYYKTDSDIADYLRQNSVREDIISAALKCDTFSKVGHLSLIAIRNILPHLEKGMIYSDACSAAGYNHSNPQDGNLQTKLPVIPDELTNNPVVHRALCQARKVVNAVIDKYGSPTYIRIEMAREIGKSKDDRAEIEKQQKKNKETRENAVKYYVGQFPHVSPTEVKGDELLKMRLYREQNGQCAYSQQPIELSRLRDSGYVEIDHILPFSRSFDNGYNNKVLVLHQENQNKRDRTPREYLEGNESRWILFENWVKVTYSRNRTKRDNLLRKDFSAQKQEDFIERNLNDTKYIARAFSQFVRQNLKFADPNVKVPVRCVNGRITAMLRGLWGLEKVRSESDLHHAMDACVIAATEQRMVQILTRWSQGKEKPQAPEINQFTGEIIDAETRMRQRLPMPWDSFRTEVILRLKEDPESEIRAEQLPRYEGLDVRPVIVSRMPYRKISGALHAETIRSLRADEQGNQFSVIRRPLTALSPTDVKNLYAPETNIKLYNVIRQRLAEFGGDAKKAFAQPLYKPSNVAGFQGPLVKSVKVMQVQNTGIKVRGGIADNGDMIRTDVFTKDGKFYLVPVYTHHFASGILPNKAVAANKSEDEWFIMDSSYEFVFTLYPYDLIRIDDNIWYYRGTHRKTGNINVSHPNDIKAERGLGPRNAKILQKYIISPLGEVHPVSKEKRLGMANRRVVQSCPA